ncbi:MAG: extracellular solute-binding protein [Chloroflexota bacterium]|nr:extracellular solute-binding protein [Chloroflexota bacterium]
MSVADTGEQSQSPMRGQPVLRRTFLKVAAGAWLAGGSLLAACSQPATSPAPGAAAPTTAPPAAAPTTAAAAKPTTAAAAAPTAAAAAPTAAPQAQATQAPAKTGAATTLEFWAFGPDRLLFVKEVMQARPEITINYRVFPYQEMHDKLLAAVTSGRGAPDIVDVEISRFGGFLKGDTVPFVPLNDKIGTDLDSLYQTAATDPWSWQGKIYGVGNELNCCLLAYRTDVMSTLGVQTPFNTWTDVTAAGKKVAAAGKSKLFALHDLHFGDYYILTQSAGSQLFDESGAFVGDNDAGVSAMQWLQDQVYKEQIAGIAPADAQNMWNGPAYWAAFKAEQFVGTFGPPWHIGGWMTNVPDQAGKWTVQPLPKGLGAGKPSASFGGTGQCIPTQSKNQDAAWQVIKAANFSKEGALTDFKQRTVFPAYKPAYDLPELKAPNAYFSGANFGEIYSTVAPTLVPFRQSPGWPDASDAVNRLVITPVMQNQKDAKSALTEAKTEIQKTMAGG